MQFRIPGVVHLAGIHLAHHHFRMSMIVLVDVDGSAVLHLVRIRFDPGVRMRSVCIERVPWNTLPKRNEINRYLSTGIRFEGVAGQTYGSEKYRILRHPFPERLRFNAVHRAARSDKKHHAARAQFRQGLGKEIVMQAVGKERLTGELRIVDVDATLEGDITDSCVEVAVRKIGFLKRLDNDVGTGEQSLRHAAGQEIHFNTGAPGARVQVFRHHHEEVANTHTGLDD